MALIPATAQVTAISLFQLAVAWFLFSDPEKLSTYTFTMILSACFALPYKPASFSEPSALSTLLAIVLAYISVSDLVSANMREEVFSFYWSGQAPMRASFWFVLVIGSFLSTPEGLSKIAKVLAGGQAALLTTGPGRQEGGLGAGVVFVWSFIMVMWWFWIYVTVRDERREWIASKMAKRD